MVPNMWKNVDGHHLPKHNHHLDEITGFHGVCEDCFGIYHGSIKPISPHKLSHKVLQLYIIKISLVSVIGTPKSCAIWLT